MATSTLFYNFKEVMLQGKINLTGDTINVALVTAAPTDFTKTQWSDISSTDVAAGGGYSAGGQALVGTLSISGTKSVFMGPTTTSWINTTAAAVGAIIYDNSTTPKYLIAYIDFGGTKYSSNGTFTITWDNTNGIFYFN